MDEQKIKNLIKVWYENKAKRESDPIFKFLCLWICFNAWLDYRSRKETDRAMINWLVKQDTITSDLVREYENAKRTRSFVNSLKSLVVLSQKKPIEDSRGKQLSIIIGDENDFPNIVNAIYRIRCNLFHGGKTADDARDQKLIESCQRILERWIGNLLASWKYKATF